MNNQAAFPTGIITNDKSVIIGGSNGMTLRDYFAAKAMKIAMETLKQDWDKDDGDEWYWNSSERDLIAEHAYQLADAMMKAREA